jgi:hypothetical protein
LDELLSLLATNRFIAVHYTTILRELRRLNVSRKKLRKIALERNEELRADFIARMAQYDPEELGFIDEMSKDERSVGRRYGRSQKNQRAEKKQVFVRGRRTSTEALLTLDGIIAKTVVEGSMTKELFINYLKFNVASDRLSMVDLEFISNTCLNIILASQMHSIPRASKCACDGQCTHPPWK